MIVITIEKMNWNILVNDNKNKILVIENESIYNSKTIGYTKKKRKSLPLKLVPWGKTPYKTLGMMISIYLLYNGLTRKNSNKLEDKRN